MTVYVFIVESGNTELFEQSFVNREIDDVKPHSFVVKMNIDKFDQMVASISQKFEDNVTVLFVDEQYQIKYYYTDEGKDYFKKIELLKQKKDQVQFCNCNWMEFMFNFGGLDDTANYIFASAENFDNIYDMANFLQLPINSNCYFVWNVKDITECNNAKSYYNIFSSIPRKKQTNSLGEPVIVDLEAIKWIIEHGVRQIQGLIHTGVLKKEAYIQKEVDCWILNPHSFFSKGIIIEYDLKPKPHPDVQSNILKGLTITEQFNEDAEYRYQIADKICRILCKYGLEFDKITTINNDPHTINFEFLLN